MLTGGGYVLYNNRSRAGLSLFAALTVTALLDLFDLLSLALPADAFFWKKYALTAESLLPPFWILCSLTFARRSGPWKVGLMLKVAIASTFLFSVLPQVLPLNAFFYAPDFPGERLLFLGNAGFFFYIGVMACLVVALVNFEATLTNASPEALWKIKFELIGLGTILAVQIFYYSQALLYRSLNMNYLPLRSFMYLVAAALMAYSLVCRRGNVRIQVSRQVAFKSVVLFAVGVYLVALGLLGEGMKYLGGAFPRTMTITLAFLAGIALLILLLSERVKREVKVVLHKNFYQNKHDYRTQWLRFTEQLSTSRSGEELLQRILAAYCDIFGIEGATLFLYEEEQGGYCARAYYEMDPMPVTITPDNPLVGFMGERAWVVNVKDAAPEIVDENGRFFVENNISFIVPLFDGERIEGFITLGRVIKQDEVYIYEDYDLMKTIARQASQAILHQRLSDEIAQAREMEAIGNVATFVVHDLKNLVATLSLIVDNAAKYMQNPDFQKDMLTSLGNTAEKMRVLIGRLKNLGDKNLLNLHPVDLLELVDRTAHLVAGGRITVSGNNEKVIADGGEIQKVVMNLLINAVEASDREQPIHAEIDDKEGMPYIRISDQGCGMSDHYLRTKLFKPFKTTKKQGLGIGLYQCRKIVESHGGRIEVSSLEGSGSVFTVWFPAATEMRPEGRVDSV
ncbi:XrtA/PEP-CTERM system histidine kinase PrsK [Geobacter sp. FeAm09]|uniref:XrtA/PEP-CTERM system histidine kinase PrsK n=1 Tax=Geobacter sp. FeAm09 TaxID=2597769 RepID=UPI00197A7972|nr:XrtA/PEP-CTERM system histidine kinase PrsK [Geobacter sp. FeAm09]